MAIYDIKGNVLTAVYNAEGNIAEKAYNAAGEVVYSQSYGELIFEDDFDTFNSENWGFEIGNVRNGELQFYRAENVSVDESNLVITAKRETHMNKAWTSGSITGQLKKSFQYGRFEARIKFPYIAGSFPAFWTLGANHWIKYAADDDSTIANSAPDGSVQWPQCGEIDIVEHYPGAGNTTTHGAIYNTTDNTSKTGINLGRNRSGTLDMTEYHVYALEWSETKILFYVDDVLVSSAIITDEMTMFRQPHYIILNLAVGAVGGTPPDDVSEMKMYVDWVRVYATS